MSSRLRNLERAKRKIARERERVDRTIAAVWEHVERGRFLLWARTWRSQLWIATTWTGWAATAWTVGWFLFCLGLGLATGEP